MKGDLLIYEIKVALSRELLLVQELLKKGGFSELITRITLDYLINIVIYCEYKLQNSLSHVTKILLNFVVYCQKNS